MRTNLIAVLAFVACAPNLTWAAMQPAPDIDCENPHTNEEMVQCAVQEWQRADAELTRMFRRTLEDFQSRPKGAAEEDDPAERLRSSQRRWKSYRDASCLTHRSLAAGGSLKQVYYYACMTELTRQRIRELEKIADY